MRLELHGVTAGYGDTVALRNLDLVVPDGRVVALLGPNGAGKTTTLSVASGLVKPRRGKILLGGKDITGLPPERRARAGLCHITEGRAVYPGLSVADNLRMFVRPGLRKDAVEKAVEAFPRLGERRRQLAGTMSGGEQQMLAIARAYVQGAPTVMLDEVSMGLAPILVDEIFAFLRRMASEGHSLLIVEQYVSKVLAMADLAYVLVRGRLVLAGEPAEMSGSDMFAQYMGAELAGAPH
jgi:branched-chain amino acid transport system ATP-binding protein